VQLIQDLQCFVSLTCKPVSAAELRYKEGAALGESDSFLDFYDRLLMIPLLFEGLPDVSTASRHQRMPIVFTASWTLAKRALFMLTKVK
jgi:hypothetical protein